MFEFTINEEIFQTTPLSEEVIEFMLDTMEEAIIEEEKDSFVLFSEALTYTFVLERKKENNKIKIHVSHAIFGELYINTGIVTKKYPEKI